MTSKSSANQPKQQNQLFLLDPKGGLTTSVASVVTAMWASRCRVLAAAASGSLLGLSCTHMDDVPWAAVGEWLGIFVGLCKPKNAGNLLPIARLIGNDKRLSNSRESI